jgi:hypothetical protein
MAFKRIFVDIQDDLFDLYTLISAERGPDDYNEAKGQLEYTLVLNATAVARDVREKVYKFTNRDERDNLLFSLKEALMKNPNIYFLGEDDGAINEDELKNAGYNKKRTQHEQESDYEE